MAEKKTQVTPFSGTIRYCWIDKPNTKFVADGEYSLDLVVPKETAAEFVTNLEELAKAAKAEAIKKDPKNAGKIKGYTMHVPVEPECDDNGDETGNLIIKFKNKAKVTKKDGTTFEKRVSIIDAKLKPVTKKVGRGSKVKVGFEPVQYVAPGLKQVGVTLRLGAVQVLELVEYVGGGGDPAAYGFGQEEGYQDDGDAGSTESFEPGDGPAPSEDDASPTETPSSDDGDF